MPFPLNFKGIRGGVKKWKKEFVVNVMKKKTQQSSAIEGKTINQDATGVKVVTTNILKNIERKNT